MTFLVRVLTSRGVAFVTYTNESNAQFAKEAMAHQSLDHSEVLNVRWATVDPNPAAQKREARRVEEQAAEAVRRALPASFVAELEGRDPEAQKRRKIEGSFGLQGYEAPDDVWFAREKASLEAAAAAEQDFDARGSFNGANRALEPPEQTLLIEGAATKSDTQNAGGGAGGGILSSMTLAALKSYAGGQTVITIATLCFQGCSFGRLSETFLGGGL